MYSIGDPRNPDKNDKRFEKYEDAEKAAILESKDNYVWAIWNDETGEVLALVFDLDVYKP